MKVYQTLPDKIITCYWKIQIAESELVKISHIFVFTLDSPTFMQPNQAYMQWSS